MALTRLSRNHGPTPNVEGVGALPPWGEDYNEREGDSTEDGEEEEESEDNSDRHMAVDKAPVATTDPADSYEVPEDIANKRQEHVMSDLEAFALIH